MDVLHSRSGVRGEVVGSWMAGEGREVVDVKVRTRTKGPRLVTISRDRFDREWACRLACSVCSDASCMLCDDLNTVPAIRCGSCGVVSPADDEHVCATREAA